MVAWTESAVSLYQTHYFSQPKEVHLEFARWLMTTLTTVVESAKSKACGQNINQETLWIKFHELTISEDFSKKWEEILKNVNTTIPLSASY